MENFAIPSIGRDVVPNREHSAQVWETYRERITHLYSEENKSLDEVIIAMQNEYGFIATYVNLQLARIGWSSVEF
jgi:hypothetical protein